MPPVSEVVLFDGAVDAPFIPSGSLLIQAERVTLDFDFVVAVGPAVFEWFPEYTSDDPSSPNARWGSEAAAPPPFVALPTAATSHRTFFAVRAHRFVRVQMRVAVGTIDRVTVRAPFGTTPATPA